MSVVAPDKWSRWAEGQTPLEGCKWSVGGQVRSTGEVGMLGWRDGQLVGTPETLAAVDAEALKWIDKPSFWPGVVLDTQNEAGAYALALAVMSGLSVGDDPEFPEFDVSDPMPKSWVRRLRAMSGDYHEPAMTPLLRPLAHARESRGRRGGSGAASRGSPDDSSGEADPPDVARRERASRRGDVS